MHYYFASIGLQMSSERPDNTITHKITEVDRTMIDRTTERTEV